MVDQAYIVLPTEVSFHFIFHLAPGSVKKRGRERIAPVSDKAIKFKIKVGCRYGPVKIPG